MTTRNSDLVANLEASPQVANKAQELQGVVRIAQGNVALLAGDIYTDAGGVKDIDFFATSVADGAAIAELRYEAADLNTTGQQLYTMAGDSTDPGGFYYIAATFDATGGTAGDMAFIIEYVVN